jgi:radical SAM superfamily enzyme YgiQ (UPF0313 family)
LADIFTLGYDHIVFYDDCLFIRSPQLDSRVLEFTDALQVSPWRGTFQLELRCDAVVALSSAALEALQAAGCIQINMGIEKAHVDTLALLQKRLSPEIARAAIERLRTTRIRAAGTFILGGPGESRSHVEQTIEFALSSHLDFAHFNPLAIYPGTRLFSDVYGTAPNWLDLCLDPTIAPNGDILWAGPQMAMAELVGLLADAYRRFYTTGRLDRLKAKLRANEIAPLSDAYTVLGESRATSWRHLSTSDPKGGVC